MKTIVLSLSIIILATGVYSSGKSLGVSSSSSDTGTASIIKNGSSNCQACPDALFGEMMKQLPLDIKSRLDSTKVTRNPAEGLNEGAVQGKKSGTDGSLKDFPDPVRERIEQTIQEMGKNTSERLYQFKEELKVEKK